MLRIFKRRRCRTRIVLLLVGISSILIYFPTAKLLSDNSTRSNVLRMGQIRYQLYQVSETNRTGPGENGAPVPELTEEEQKLANELTGKEGFNVVRSEKIALDRALTDKRTAQ